MTRHPTYRYRESPSRAEAPTADGGDALENDAMHQGALQLPLTISLVALALAHLFDYTSFLLMVERHGLAAEANPIVVAIARQAGLVGLTLAKVVTVAFASLLMVLIAPRRKWVATGLLVVGIGAGLVGGITNVATL